MFLLGAFANKPNLILSSKYKINKEDFKCKGCEDATFHNILYRTMYNLVIQGAEEIDEVLIDQFLQSHPQQYKTCKEFGFMEFIPTIKSLSNAKNIDYHYGIVRKFSMLRQYKANGFDIHEIFDELKDEDSERGKLDDWSLEDIDSYFEKKRLNIKNSFVSNENMEHYKAGDDFSTTKETFKDTPSLGLSFQSSYLNDICRGIQGFTLRSGQSGGGKTMLSVGDMCMSCVKYLYDEEKDDFVENKSYVGNGLFINTEMDLRKELDVMFIAWISCVPRYHILNGRYQAGEEDRVNIATEILEKSGIFVVDDPEFTCKTLDETIEDYIINKNVQLVCFDYCQNNGFVAGDLSKESGIPMREDMVLLTLTDRLKQISRKYDVPILSGTQLNGQEYNMAYPTEACLAGGKSQVRKCDTALVIMPMTNKNESEIESYLYQLEGKHKPNIVTHVIKGRHTRFPKYSRIYSYADLNTGRVTDLFATNRDLEPLDVEPLIISFKKELA